MSDKEEKVNYRKETYVVVLTTLLSTVLGKVDGWLEKADWKVPDWVMQAAAWFADKTPINNAVLLWLTFTGVYMIWLGMRYLLENRRVLGDTKTALNDAHETLKQAKRDVTASEDKQIELQENLARATAELASIRQQLESRLQETEGKLSAAEIKDYDAEVLVPRRKEEIKREHESFTDATFDGIHWRWQYDAYGKVWGLESYCENCDLELPVSGLDVGFGGYYFLSCSECGHETKLPDTFDGNVASLHSKAAGKIARAMRIGTWRELETQNKVRKMRIERERPGEKAAPGPTKAIRASRETVNVSLSVAITLEGYTRLCTERIWEVKEAEEEASREHSYDPLGPIKFPAFAYPDSIDWKWLQPDDAATLRNFEVSCDASAKHVRSVANALHCDPFDYVAAVSLECAKLGQKAWRLAANLRTRHGLPAAELGEHDQSMHETLEARIQADLIARQKNEELFGQFRQATPESPAS